MRAPISRSCAGLLLVCAVATANAERIDVAASGKVGVVVVAADSQCSLREAMLLGNGAAANGDCVAVVDGNSVLTLNLPSEATFSLLDGPYDARGPNGLPDVNGSYAIEGHEAVITRSAASGTPRFRLLHVAEGGDLTVRDVTFSNGHTLDGIGDTLGDVGYRGGGIYNEGILALIQSTVTANAAGDGGHSTTDNGGDGGDGGGIYNAGTLTIDASEITLNAAGNGGGAGADGIGGFRGGVGYGGTGGNGGGIFNAGSSGGTLALTGSTVGSNSAGHGGDGSSGGGDGGQGGGIYFQNTSSGALTVQSSVIRDNKTGDGGADLPGGLDVGCGGGGDGGGLYFVVTGASPPTITDSVIEDNAAGDGGSSAGIGGSAGDGGGIAGQASSSSPPFDLAGSVILRNDAGAVSGTSAESSPGSGGGIYCDCSLHLTDSLVSGNTIPAAGNEESVDFYDGGAGIHVSGIEYDLKVVRSTIRDNAAHAGHGGGILADVGDSMIHDSSIIDNVASGFGGGVRLSGNSAIIVNSTLAANTAEGGYGGGIFLRRGGGSMQVHISYSTISANTGSGIDSSESWTGVVQADHSIIAAQASGPDCGDSDLLSSLGYNLDSDGSCQFAATGDLSSTAPLLSGLSAYRGTMPVLLPMTISPVLDAIPISSCGSNAPSGIDVSMDQRGWARPTGLACDIGAAERTILELRGLGQNNQVALVGDVFNMPLVVQALLIEDGAMVGIAPDVKSPEAGPSAVCTGEPTDPTGLAKVYCAASGQAGTYTVHISLFGSELPDISVDYTLTNLPNDRIFGTGFSGTALPTAESLP